MDDRLFDRAREAVSCRDVAERKGVTLRKAGKTHRGVCPLQGCGSKSKLDPFVVKDSGRRWVCYSCDPRGGDVVDLEHRLFSAGVETLADAARRLAGGDVRRESDEERDRRSHRLAQEALEATRSADWKAALALRLWREAGPAAGSLAQTYFEARLIHGPVLARGLEILRFHPRAYHSGHPDFGVFLPAVIGLVMTEYGPTGGVHATYLAPDGRRKTHRKPAKRMWGPQGHVGPDGVIRPGGIWLTRPDAPGPLVTAEGTENTLSRAMMKAGELSLPVRAVAAGSLDRLQGYELVDADGCRDVVDITPDPARPPFTWPEDPANPWGEVDVATDGDMSPVRVMGRNGRGRPTRFTRDAAERARVCGVLATRAWRGRLALGSATRVGWSRPPIGLDFNDELGRVQAPAETASEAA